MTRTREQIIAQLEARYAELEAEAASPKVTMPCAECKWAEKNDALPYCYHPLITGLEGKNAKKLSVDTGSRQSDLCGPEKVLWEEIPPKLTRWQKFWNWFIAPWRES